MIAFDASGTARWIVPNETPQIATADGGVIAQSGITYDQNGNATGQVNMATYSWIQQSYVSTGGQTAAVEVPVPEWATSYTAMEGGSLSPNGAAVGVAESIEGRAIYALNKWGPTCELAGDQPSLSDPALANYIDKKQALIDGHYMTSKECKDFFASDARRAPYFSKLTTAVTQALPAPYDGLLTNISAYAAGFMSANDEQNPLAVSIFKSTPVCGYFVSYREPNGHIVKVNDETTAAANIHPPGGGPATDIYINTALIESLTQATILHEALHNLTGMYDGDLELLLGLSPPYLNGHLNPKTNCGPGVGTTCITTLLRNKGCAGPN
jgi:hypothetical protein